MRGDEKSAAEAAQHTSDFIGDQRDKARQIQADFEKAGGVGMSDQALEEFGKALARKATPIFDKYIVIFSAPGSSESEQGEALYEYRLGVTRGLNLDWRRSRAQ